MHILERQSGTALGDQPRQLGLPTRARLLEGALQMCPNCGLGDPQLAGVAPERWGSGFAAHHQPTKSNTLPLPHPQRCRRALPP